MSDVWNAITGGFETIMVAIHNGIEPVFGTMSWGWAIILLTIGVRVLLLPLAIKQTRSMRAMQELQPKIKAIQKKYKTDRELMRKDPELYRKRKQKLNEETMALYKDEGVNPASGCLPLLAQMPVFFALFSVLRGSAELVGAPFHFFTGFANLPGYRDALASRLVTENDAGRVILSELGDSLVSVGAEQSVPQAVDSFVSMPSTSAGLDMGVNLAGWPGILLILLMGITMFLTQRQMMARTAVTDPQQQQTQKIMLYVMPVFLAAISWTLPLGVLLYWVTTNIWQVVQQQIILREVAHADTAGKGAARATGNGAGKGRKISKKPPATPDGPTARGGNGRKSADSGPSKPKPPSPDPTSGPRKRPKKDHLPRRPGA